MKIPFAESTRERAERTRLKARMRCHIERLARQLQESLAPEEREILLDWLVELLEIRESHVSASLKFARAIRATVRRRTVVTILKTTGRPFVRLAWADRTWMARLAMLGVVVTSLVWRGHQAGIALLGTAVAVPLWVVFGSGAVVAGWMVDSLRDSLPPHGFVRIWSRAHAIP